MNENKYELISQNSEKNKTIVWKFFFPYAIEIPTPVTFV